jgi:uncharacterized protein (TIGR02266 family)
MVQSVVASNHSILSTHYAQPLSLNIKTSSYLSQSSRRTLRALKIEDFHDALIHNISQAGVYLATDAPFDVGYQFALEIDLPNDKGQIKGKCEVIWVNEIEAEDYPKGMGVQLFELEPKDRGHGRTTL